MNHSFDIEDAKKYGMAEAVLLYNIKFWVAKNAANKKHFYDGFTWTYNSVKAWGELFPYLTANQIRRGLESLEKQGAIKSGNYNQSAYDRTKWVCVLCPMEMAKMPNGDGKNAKTLIYTDIKPDAREDSGFSMFWKAYPNTKRKQSMGKCEDVWLKNNMMAEKDKIIEHIEDLKQSFDWIKDDGQYIPAPLTYLNQRRWEGAEPTEKQTNGGILAGAI